MFNSLFKDFDKYFEKFEETFNKTMKAAFNAPAQTNLTEYIYKDSDGNRVEYCADSPTKSLPYKAWNTQFSFLEPVFAIGPHEALQCLKYHLEDNYEKGWVYIYDYNGVVGEGQWDEDSQVWEGCVVKGIEGECTFSSDELEDLDEAFYDSVDEYMDGNYEKEGLEFDKNLLGLEEEPIVKVCPICQVQIQQSDEFPVKFSYGNPGTKERLYARVCQYAKARGKVGCINNLENTDSPNVKKEEYKDIGTF